LIGFHHRYQKCDRVEKMGGESSKKA
jgi:hypothetical protein